MYAKSKIDYIDIVFRGYISPVIAVLGIFGNTVAVIVFTRNRDNRFAIYSGILALVNIFILVFNTFLDDFLGRGLQYASGKHVDIKIDIMSLFSCRLMGYIPNVMYCSSSYILVALSIDRCMVLRRPMTYTVNRGIKSAVLICSLIIVSSMFLNVPVLITSQISRNPSYNSSKLTVISTPEFECIAPNSTFSRLGLYWKSVFTFAVPTALVISLNSIIIFTITNTQSSYSSSIIRGVNSRSEQSRFIGHLAVSCLFTVLFLPLSILILMRLKHSSHESSTTYPLLKALSKLLSSVKDISYAANVLLYLLFMPHFREKAWSIFCCTNFRRKEVFQLDLLSANRARTSLLSDHSYKR